MQKYSAQQASSAGSSQKGFIILFLRLHGYFENKFIE